MVSVSNFLNFFAKDFQTKNLKKVNPSFDSTSVSVEYELATDSDKTSDFDASEKIDSESTFESFLS